MGLKKKPKVGKLKRRKGNVKIEIKDKAIELSNIKARAKPPSLNYFLGNASASHCSLSRTPKKIIMIQNKIDQEFCNLCLSKALSRCSYDEAHSFIKS